MSSRVQILRLVMFFSLLVINASFVGGHLTGGITKTVGNHRIQFGWFPDPPTPEEEVGLNFSIQDLEGNNLKNLRVSIKISLDKVIVFVVPPGVQPYGDFVVTYSFATEGNYKVTLEIIETGVLSADFDLSVTSKDMRFIRDVLPIAFPVVLLSAIGILVAHETVKARKKRSASDFQKRNSASKIKTVFVDPTTGIYRLTL